MALQRYAPMPKAKRTWAESNASRRVKLAAGGLCQFERKHGRTWAVCGKYGSQACHIYKRDDCARLKTIPMMMIWGCFECHKRQHAGERDVRFPPAKERAAYRALVFAANTGVNKLFPARLVQPR